MMSNLQRRYSLQPQSSGERQRKFFQFTFGLYISDSHLKSLKSTHPFEATFLSRPLNKLLSFLLACCVFTSPCKHLNEILSTEF